MYSINREIEKSISSAVESIIDEYLEGRTFGTSHAKNVLKRDDYDSYFDGKKKTLKDARREFLKDRSITQLVKDINYKGYQQFKKILGGSDDDINEKEYKNYVRTIVKNVIDDKNAIEKDNNIKLSGKSGFDILLNVIADFDLLFIKQDYLNTGEFLYFFTTEKITKIQELENVLENKKSLNIAYLTLRQIKNMRLSFFFGIRDNILTYGFYNETNRYIYKVGTFTVTTKDIKKLSYKKSLKTIRNILLNNNLKNLKELHKIKVDFHTIFNNVENDVEIIDEYIIKNTILEKSLTVNDENQLTLYLTQWSRNFNWHDKCYYYVRTTPKYLHFYIKLKSQI